GHRRELSHLLYTERYVSKEEYFAPDRPHSEHILALAHALGCAVQGWSIDLPATGQRERATMAAALAAAFAAPAPLIAVAPGTQWASKRWPAEFWLALLRRIVSETPANVVLVGAATDAAGADHLVEQLGGQGRGRMLNLCGKTSLPELF